MHGEKAQWTQFAMLQRWKKQHILPKELLHLISRNEEKLLATMTDVQKELFSRYQDCVREFQAMAECLLFRNSFCLGARIMLAVVETDFNNHNYR